ncbi:MAG: ribonuclease H-like domain-containing protein [Anaerolineales bacterium]
MSSLSDKLRSLGVQIGTQGVSPPTKSAPPPQLIDVIPGMWKSTSHGETFIVEKRYPLDFSLGSISIQPSFSVHPLSKWIGEPSLGEYPLGDYAFIDTETTGLSGGTGVYTFLIGVGRFQEDHFHISQFFLQDPAQETAQLSALEKLLAPTKVIISYNGKAFDLPRLKSRYQTHHWPPPLRSILHIDLLHLSRRLWNNQLSSCTLGDIESCILNFERSEEDVPGWQVSDLFFEYLHTQDPTPLKRIFYHNEMDVLSMAAILNRISDILNPPHRETIQRPEELLSAGKFFADLNEPDNAISLLEQSICKLDSDSDLYYEGVKSLSFLHKKKGDYHRAVPLWKEATNRGDFYAYIELAKYYEHHQKEYQEAIHWTLSAISEVDNARLETHKIHSLKADLEHRLNRLKKKLE